MAEGIEVIGAEKIIKSFKSIESLKWAEPPMHRAMLRLQAGMAKYPPPPAGSKYRRTGTLGRRWTTAVTYTNDSLRGRVGNNTLYGPYVESAQFQAHQHRGRWQTDLSVLNEERNHIINDFNRVINGTIGG